VLGERREADQVGEEDGDEASLCGRSYRCGTGRCGGCECRPALAAELHRWRIRCPARRTRKGERRAALAAELAARFVLRATRSADEHVRHVRTLLRGQRYVQSTALRCPRGIRSRGLAE